MNKKIMLFIPFLALAGAEVMVGDLAKGLSELGCEVIVVSFYDYHSEITKSLENRGIRVIYLDKKPGIDFSIFYSIYRLIKKEKPDVVHTHLNVVKYVMPSAICLGVKCCVHTVHNIADKEQGKLDRRITKFFAKRFKLKLVGITPIIKESIIKEYELDESKVPMVYNGRDLGQFLPKTDYNSAEDEVKVLHVGRFTKQKNHEMLLNAFKNALKENARLRLYLIGDGELIQPMKEFATRIGITDHVCFLGIRNDVNDLMVDADIFVLPSIYEGMPITLIEAMSCGLPIVATRVGGVPDMLSEDNAILINTDENELSSAILRLASSSDMRKKLGMNAAKESMRFSYKTMAKEYINTYFV